MNIIPCNLLIYSMFVLSAVISNKITYILINYFKFDFNFDLNYVLVYSIIIIGYLNIPYPKSYHPRIDDKIFNRLLPEINMT